MPFCSGRHSTQYAKNSRPINDEALTAWVDKFAHEVTEADPWLSFAPMMLQFGYNVSSSVDPHYVYPVKQNPATGSIERRHSDWFTLSQKLVQSV